MRKKAVILMIGAVLLTSFAVTIEAARPTVRISAVPTTIVIGSSSTLTWTSSGATSASINQGIGSVAVNGSLAVSPTATITYTITARNSSGSTTARATVTVKAAPPTVSFSAAPTTIPPGGSATLSWTTTGATSASINQNIGTVAVNGSKVVKPTTTKTYTITVKGSGGTVTATAKVTVVVPPPTVSFSATPATIPPGGSATLSWTTTGATSASIDQDIGAVSTSGSIAIYPNQTTLYTITVIGPGGTTTAYTQVTVTEPAPQVTIQASPITIKPGQSATLTWTSSNADSASIDNDIGDVELNGSRQLSPAKTTKYTISVSGPSGTATAIVTVFVSGNRQGVLYITDRSIPNVRVFDADNGELLNTIDIPNADTKLYGVETDPSGAFAYVANTGANTIHKIDPLTMTLKESVGGIATGPQYLAAAPDGRFLYATIMGTYWNGQELSPLYIISTNGNSMWLFKTLFIPGERARGLVVSPDSSRLYISFSFNKVLVFNTATLQQGYSGSTDFDISDDLLVEYAVNGSYQMAISPDGRELYVLGSEGLSVFDTVSNTLKKTIAIFGSFIKVSPDGAKIYIMHSYNGLSVVETTGLTVVKSYLTIYPYNSQTLCEGLSVHPDGSRLYVRAGSTYVVETETYTGIVSIPGGGSYCCGNYMNYLPLTISGKVTQDGSGLANAKVFLDGEGIARSFTTAPDGKYIFAAKKEGQFKVTPEYQNLLFSPESLSFTVNGDLADQDFVVTGIYPLPTVTLSASSTWVKPYESFTLPWTSTGAEYVIIWSYSSIKQAPNGSVTIALSATTTFTATAYGRGGTASADVKVYVSSTLPPTASISASPASIPPGGSSTLTWSTTKVSTVTIDNGIGTVAVSGSKTVSPQQTTIYTITATASNGYQVTASATVTVNAAVPSVQMNSSPGTIYSGESSTLTWTSQNAVTASIDNGIGAVPVNGSSVVTPATTTTYKITVTGPGGSNIAQVTVTVEIPQPQVQFKADPEVLPPGQSATLNWTTVNVTSASIDNGIGSVPINGLVKVTPTQDTTYIITVTGPGGSTTASVIVKMLFNHLYSIWNGMKTALANGNTNMAANFFDEETKANYLEIFDANRDQLPQIAADMRDIEPVVYFEDGGAQFRIKRKEILAGTEYDITYYIYFVRGNDGVWRILKY